MQQRAWQFVILKSEKSKMKIQRKGGVIKLRPEKYQEYKDYHANVWPGVLKQLEGRSYFLWHFETLRFK